MTRIFFGSKQKRRVALRVSVACPLAMAGIFAASTAVAQEAAADGDNNQDGLGEIIVTAQKRSENLQRVPIAVSTMTAEGLEASGIVSTRDLNAAVPGLTVGGFASSTSPFLRGIGQIQALAGLESPTAVYIDGVYLLSPGSAAFSLNNIEQVEVLRGPQGTLFGRNATGGVIHVKTKAPSSDPALNLSVGYGNHDTWEANAYATGGIAPGLATSLTVHWRDQMDGYGHNLYLGTQPFKSREFAVQSKTAWNSSDDRTAVELNLLYDKSRFSPGLGIAPGMLAEDGVTRYAGPYVTYARRDALSDNEQYLASLKISHDFDWGSVSNLAAYHYFTNRVNFTQNAIPGIYLNPTLRFAINGGFDNDGNTFTNEFQIVAPTDSTFQWAAGIFYLNDKSVQRQSVMINDTPFFNLTGRVRTESIAAYAQGTYPVTSTTRLTLGARYTSDTIHFAGTATNNPPSPAAGGVVPKITNADPTFRVVLDQDLATDVMGYISWNRGFRSGRYVINNFSNQPVDPETIDSYELGFKSKLFDNRLRLNIAAFYYKYKDIQVRAQTVGGISATVNAGAARGKGVDIDFEAAPTDGLRIMGGVEILDAEYTHFPGGPCPTPLPTGGNDQTTTCDLAGRDLPFAPKFAATIRLTQTIPSSIGDFDLSVGDAYSSSYSFEADGLVRQPSFHNVSASIGWTDLSDRLSLRLWGKNLADEAIMAIVSTNSSTVFIPGEPRRYGITATAKF